MNLVGGVRKNIGEYDFKYTFDISRQNWIKSVYPYLENLLNIVVNIPYDTYNYNGDIVYTYSGVLKEYDESYKPQTSMEDLPNPIIRQSTFRVEKKNSVSYNFFGGICFELLNDSYPNVNLYDYVDPTSDIDILITAVMPEPHTTMYAELFKKHNKDFEEIIHDYKLVIEPSLEEPGLIPYLNPYFMHLSNFIFESMLEQLNDLTPNFINSVPFDIDEYTQIDDQVKTGILGFRVVNIHNSNAKLIRYLDSNLKTLRIQIILKIVIGDETIIDHLLEFLFYPPTPMPKPWSILNITHLVENPNVDEVSKKVEEAKKIEAETNVKQQIWILTKIDKPVVISELYTLFDDNLEAYKKREFELKQEGPRRHKPINHITRVIYLLDLIKNNPDIFDKLGLQRKQLIGNSIEKQMVPSYTYYKVINNNFVLVSINTINIIYAFYALFVKIFLTRIQYFIKKNQINNQLISEDPINEEEKYYAELTNMFKINASPLRKMTTARNNLALGRRKKTHKRTKKSRNQKNKNKSRRKSRRNSRQKIKVN